MHVVRIGVLMSVLAIAALLVVGTAALPVARASSATTEIAQSAGSLSVEIFDLFNVPYSGWWDFRAVYGDLPIGADCFSFDNIPGGAGSPNPSGTGACDLPPAGYSGETWITYPYVNALAWVGDRRDVQIYAPYRMRMIGTDQPGATLAQPVYLPVFNAAQPPGTTLRLKWDFNYLTKAETAATDALCGSAAIFGYDGFVARNIFTVTMDLNESKRLFGVAANTPDEAAAWWAANSDPDCAIKFGIESKWEAYMAAQGGSSLVMGPYDLWSSWEWFYQPFMTNLVASVDPATGLTTVMIDHVVWGTEVLFSRYFYWGSTLYLPNAEIYPHNNAGWWPWELAWFEDLHFDTTIGATSQAFSLETVMQYHLTAFADPGLDGFFHSATVTSTDDVAAWLWMPVLTDYVYGGFLSPKHTVSEIDPYAGKTYLYARPGTVAFGTQYQYDLVPAAWDLGAGDTVVIRAPNSLSPNGGAIRFVDPYSPLVSDVTQLVLFSNTTSMPDPAPFLPAGSSVSDSDGDLLPDTLTLVGLIDWGAPGQPLWGFPALLFTPQARPPPPECKADLVGRSAWPERHHFVLSKDADGAQDLFAKVVNLGTKDCNAAAVFTIRDSAGSLVATIQGPTGVIPFGQIGVLMGAWTSPAAGRYIVEAKVLYDQNGDGTLDTLSARSKFFSFTVVP